MGTFVELDPWERADAETVVEEPEELSHLQVWANLLPPWAWTLIGCNLLVVVFSVVVRLFTPTEGITRMVWSVSQLFIGFAVFSVCHVLAYFATIELDADYALLDIILKPLKILKTVVQRLPRSIGHLTTGTCGINAVLMSFLVIGALPYHVLLDWGIKAPPKADLVKAIVTRAMEEDGDENGLEDAIGEFAGADEDPFAAAAAEEERATIDCLVVGYTMKPDKEEIASLVLAREYHGELVVVGRAAAVLADEDGVSYLKRFRKIARRTPFVHSTMSAYWIDPVYTCRATYRSETSTGKLRDIRFEEMLGSLRLN